jgi:hypothetical protein
MYAVTAHQLHHAGFSPMASPYVIFYFIFSDFFSSLFGHRPKKTTLAIGVVG